MQIAEHAVRYLAFLYKRKLSYSSIRDRASVLKVICREIGALDAADVDERAGEVMGWVYDGLTQNVSQNSGAHYWLVAKIFFTWISSERQSKKLPRMENVRRYIEGLPTISKDTRVPREYFYEEELERRIQTMPPKYQLMAYLGAYAGMRIKEIRYLKGRSIRPDGILVGVEAQDRRKGSAFGNVPKTKSRKSAELVRCSQWLHDMLVAYVKKNRIEEGMYLFASPRKALNKPVSSQRVQDVYKGLFESHDLRAWYAATLETGGVKPNIIRRRLRHSTIDVSVIYLDRFNMDPPMPIFIKWGTLERMGIGPQHLIRPDVAPKDVLERYIAAIQAGMQETATEELEEVAG